MLAVLVAAWSVNQLLSFGTVIIVQAGQWPSFGVDAGRASVLAQLNAFQIALIAANAFGYAAAAILLARASRITLPVYGLALSFDLIAWLTYSTLPAYENQPGQSIALVDWVTNIVLFGVLLALIGLGQIGVLNRRGV